MIAAGGTDARAAAAHSGEGARVGAAARASEPTAAVETHAWTHQYAASARDTCPPVSYRQTSLAQ